MNAMDGIKSGKCPYYIRAGFYVFLESERIRHLNDAAKILRMQKELQEITPEFEEKAIEGFKSFAKHFINFSFEDKEKKET